MKNETVNNQKPQNKLKLNGNWMTPKPRMSRMSRLLTSLKKKNRRGLRPFRLNRHKPRRLPLQEEASYKKRPKRKPYPKKTTETLRQTKTRAKSAAKPLTAETAFGMTPSLADKARQTFAATPTLTENLTKTCE